MSENCNDPNCPEHGESEESKAQRAMQAKIKSNDELMGVIRILAANAHDVVEYQAVRRGLMPDPCAAAKAKALLTGNHDGDPIIEGIVRGLVVLGVATHAPTVKLMDVCAEIKGPNVVERLVEEQRQKYPEPEAPVVMFGSFDDLVSFLKDRR